MASIFGHSVAAVALGQAVLRRRFDWKFGLLAALVACAPDLDVLAFEFGIPYQSQWGHRGFTHSLLFAAVFGGLVSWIFYRKTADFFQKTIVLVVSVASHALLDMCTNGGRGVALFWPITEKRLFFPWRPIQVSPISPTDFRGDWALEVLWTEIIWIGLPSIFLLLAAKWWASRR